MIEQSVLDCILVGYNDVDFDQFVTKQKKMAQYTGAYHEIVTNSVLLHGKRTTYMDLINHAVTRATGKNPRLNAFEAPSLGCCYLKSYLKQRGFGAEIVNFFTHQKDRFKELLAAKPKSVAITTTYYIDNAPIIEIVQFVRKHSPTTKIIVGGPHIYNLSCDLDAISLEYVFRSIGADIYITDSQGEQTLADVCGKLRDGGSFDGIANLCYFDGDGGYQATERSVENNDLDSNSVHWEHMEKGFIAPLTYMRTARSCPFSCSFCNYPTIAGKHVLLGQDPLISELDYLHEIGTEYLVFIDDTFNVPLPRFKKLLRAMIEKDYGFRWISFFRCSNADEEVFDLMKASGCMGVFLGIESGDQTILNNMNKYANVARYKWGISQLKQRDILTFASIICGFPGETHETLANTIAFLEETKPTFFNVQLYYHDTRSPIHNRAEEFGIEGAGYNWKHNTMDWKEAATLAKQAFKTIKNSIPLSLYGFSLWGIPYLVAKGISIPEIVSFGEITREMLVESFDDIPVDFSQQERRLTELFRDSRLARELAGNTEALAG